MDDGEERSLLRKIRRRRGDDIDDLGDSEENFFDEFEKPDTSDVLTERQVRESKRKRV